jgi:thioredoxin-related protein/Tfp pilus assembly protein PilF
MLPHSPFITIPEDFVMLRIRPLVVATGLAVLSGLLALGTVGRAAEDLWTTDFEAAKAKAKAEKKLLLVDFTGSDWCGWCIKLRDEVFDKDEFKKAAPKRFVLIELDFPRQKELPEKLKAQNEKLAEKYKVRGFPSILLMDAEGQVVARTGYRDGGPEKYVQHLDDFVKLHASTTEMRAALKKLAGLARAKSLDQLIEALAKLGSETDEIDAWSKEIVKLDADNRAGLKIKYEFRIFMAEAAELKEAKKFDEAKAAIDKALALPGISGEQKQDAYFAQGECFFHAKDFAGIAACLKKAVDAAPDSPKVPDLKQMLQRFGPLAEAQEAVVKLKAELEGAKGLGRAKVLDKLVDARQKLNSVMPGADASKEIAEWSQEIAKLDAGNKAGLKGKHQVLAARTEGMTLARSMKFDEAQAVIDKVLAGDDLTPENRQQGLQVKGLFYMLAREHKPALAALQKALKAAPDGAHAAEIQTMIERCEGQLERQKETKEKEKKTED